MFLDGLGDIGLHVGTDFCLVDVKLIHKSIL